MLPQIKNDVYEIKLVSLVILNNKPQNYDAIFNMEWVNKYICVDGKNWFIKVKSCNFY